MGRLKNKEDENEHIDVAIKKLKNSVTKKQRSEFVKEAKLMRRLSHPNIIQVIGVAAQAVCCLVHRSLYCLGRAHTDPLGTCAWRVEFKT